jgi:hypothetical protein
VTLVEDLVKLGIYPTVIILILVLMIKVSVERRRMAEERTKANVITMRCSHRRKGPQPTRKSHSVVIDELLKIVADGNMLLMKKQNK